MAVTTQITAKDALYSIDSWRRNLWPAWNLERKIEIYANGGPPPAEDTEDSNCDDEIVPLGYAKQFMQRQMDALTDPFYIEPGFIHAKWIHPEEDSADRKSHVETALNETLNAIVCDQMTTELEQAAGRLTVTGRCSLYRRSPNDWLIRNGRIIHPQSAGVNALDDTFREWAFQGKLSLKDIEENIRESKPTAMGWRKDNLEKLKLWIMAAESMKTPKTDTAISWGTFAPAEWLNVDLYGNYACEPIDVYWYYRKNGKRTEEGCFAGHEKVDLYCICRFGQSATVGEKNDSTGITKWLSINNDDNEDFKKLRDEYRRNGNEHKACEMEDNDRLVYFFPDRFESIEECTWITIDDARVAGEQKLAEVRGVGRTAMPKLAVQEGLLSAVIEGMTFAAQPNWSINGAVGEADRRQLERKGTRSFESFPNTITPMAKQNAMTGFGQAFDLIRLLDTSIAADSRVAGSPVLGGAQAEFAAQASAQLGEAAQAASRRMSKWLKFLSKIAKVIGRTLCQEPDFYKKSMPCYWDAKRLQKEMEDEWDVKKSEDWDYDDWKFEARKVAGSMQRQQAVAMAGSMIQLVGSTYPSLVPKLAKEALRAVYGDTQVDQWLNPPQEKVELQSQIAFRNVVQTFTSAVPAIPAPTDDPTVNVGVVLNFAQSKLQQFQSAGVQSPAEMAGMGAVLTFGVGFVNKLPEPLRQPILQQFATLAQAGQKIPATKPPQAGDITPLEAAKLQLAAKKDDRLAKDGAEKARINEIKTMGGLAAQATKERIVNDQMQTNATTRAKTLVDIAGVGNNASAP